MVTLGPKPKVENPQEVLSDKVNRQVAKIVEAAVEPAVEPANQPTVESATWAYSMPFAGVRYYSYLK